MQREVIRFDGFSDLEAIQDQVGNRATRSWRVYSFWEPPTSAQVAWLLGNQSRFPDEITVRFFECDQSDFDFLRQFREIKSLNIQLAFELEDLDFLKGFNCLDLLCLPETKSSRISLLPLVELKKLRVLHISGPKSDVAMIGRIRTLEKLKLERCKLMNASFLNDAVRLNWLAIHLGSIGDSRSLAKLRIRYLRLMEVKGLADLGFLSSMERLEVLHLEGMLAVKSLPDFSGQKVLRRIYLNRLKGLQNISLLLTASNLVDLIMEESPMDVESVRVLQGHPVLRHARIGTKSSRMNAAIERELPFGPEVPQFVYADGSVE